MKHELINASAGTGKTHALAERLTRLLHLPVSPPAMQEIAALTFSRAAAGEIFERFLKMLADEAEKDPSSGAVDTIRSVIASQHLSQIGTLDSFLMRMVRAFPLEAGLCGDLVIMSDYESGCARAGVSFEILRKSDKASKKAFTEAFSLVMNKERVRSFMETYLAFVKECHEIFLANADGNGWGEASSILTENSRIKPAGEDDLARAADALAPLENGKEWEELVEWTRSFRGSFRGMKGLAKKIIESDDIFEGSSVEFTYGRKKYSFSGSDAERVREAVASLVGYALGMNLAKAKGIFVLVKAFESLYAKKVRSRGRLVFSDVPRLVSALDPAGRAGLEYRLDSRIRAWALDEFQDTSREQWKALSGLVHEARSSADKPVLIVGDVKQAIYGWRNGDVRIMKNESESGYYSIRSLDSSWRSSSPVIDAVNAVFSSGRISSAFPKWKSAVHKTVKTHLPGFVQVVEAAGRKKSDFAAPAANALKAVDPVGRGLSAAVLVRTNDLGELLASELRDLGVEGVVWEGESDILDTPALSAFFDIVYLADHPGDKRAYRHFKSTCLSRALYGEGEIPPAAEISAFYAHAFATKGMVRVFRSMRAALPESSEEAWSAFTESRFTDMLRAAADFELVRTPETRIADFMAFLSSRKKRNVAEPGKIKVMTIHRSKGLAFDYVVLPVYEKKSVDSRADGFLIGNGWVLPDPGAEVERFAREISPGFAAAVEERQARSEQEALCAYYVAMTRARFAMTVITMPPAKKSGCVYFSDLVREALTEDKGDPAWYLSAKGEKGDGNDADDVYAPPMRGKREHVKRRLPSLHFVSGQSAGDLFLPGDARRAAMERGVARHAALEKVEWVDATEAADEFDRALAKPSGATGLWREKAFEIYAGGEWTSGRFDRVVFSGEGDSRRAVVQDFKTDRPRRGETAEEFEARLRRDYAPQMASYRRAVAFLTGIAFESVAAELLVTSTRAVVRLR